MALITTEYSPEQEELRQGIKLLLGLLDTRLAASPLTVEEKQAIADYNEDCSIHLWYYESCKACNGIMLAATCLEGNPTV